MTRTRAALPWRSLTMVGALLAIWAVFSLTTQGTFLSPRNLSLLARQMAVTSILATGMVLVIVAGQIDLSVGALSGVLGAVSALAIVRGDWPVPLGCALVIAAGAACGALHGTLVARLRIPPFIVTLGGMLLYQGSILGLTGGVSITPPCAWRAWRETAGRVTWIAAALLALGGAAVMNAYQGVPLPVLLVLVLAALLHTVATRTPFGRHLYAIGGSRDAAFYSGVPIERRLVGVFTLMGALCGVAGVVLTARVGAATSDAGRMMELDAIAAAVIGGTSLMGGQGTVWGALLGALVMASLDNGMSLMNTEAFWQPILKGAILIAAVAVDMAGRRDRR